MKRERTLVLVSNRLPASVEAGPDGPVVKPSAGGLVTALRPVLKTRKGYWIGWAGKGSKREIQKLVKETGKDLGCQMIPVSLTAGERERFYAGFQRDRVAAVPRSAVAVQFRSELLESLCDREPEVRQRGGERGEDGCGGMGA